MVDNKPATQYCPVCGGDNHCAMAAGDQDSQCWCYSITISAEALAAIPDTELGQRCLCPACAAKQGDKSIER